MTLAPLFSTPQETVHSLLANTIVRLKVAQFTSYSQSVKRALPWIIVVAGVGALATYVFKTYQLHQNVKCEFGTTDKEKLDSFSRYSNAVKQNGDPADKFCLARMHVEGIGTSQSSDKARELYKQAAQSGLLYAKYALCSDKRLFESVALTQNEFEEFRYLATQDVLGYQSTRDCSAPTFAKRI